MSKKISIIGAGSWGTALAALLAESRASIRIWGHNPKVVEELRTKRTNEAYLPGVLLPPNVYATESLAETLDAGVILMVTPSKAFREVATRIAAEKPRPQTVFVSCTKGIEHGSGKLMTHVLKELMPGNPAAVLSGPNHAEEVAQRIPAAGVVGCDDSNVAADLQRLFSLSTFRAYTSDDLTGIQLGGALKNIFAIAAGASDGFNMGDNAKAGLVTRALVEMTRLGTAMGGRTETFQGLSGIGDLMVTCFSRHSRNRMVGERIGRGESLEKIQSSMNMVAEGVPTTRSALEVAKRLDVECPITEQVHAVLYEGKAPHDAMWELLGRAPKAEPE